MIDVVWSDFVKILNDFYNSMINMKECFDDERAAWNIHQFLMDQLNLLNNGFIFLNRTRKESIGFHLVFVIHGFMFC